MDLFFLLSCCGSDIIPPVKRIRSMHNVECKLKIAKWGGQEPCFTFSFCTLHFAFSLSLSHLEHGKKSLLRKLDAADLLHPLFAFLLLLKKFPFSRDIAPVALCGHVLAERLHGLAGNDLGPDRGLNDHLIELPRNNLFQALGKLPPAQRRLLTMRDQRQ